MSTANTGPRGTNAILRLGTFLHSLIDFTSHSQPPEQKPQFNFTGQPVQHEPSHSQEYEPMSENNQPPKQKSSHGSSGLITAIVSLIALIFSGFSFYETVLKEAELKIYAPPIVHLYRKNFRDVFAIPLTVSNDGAKRGTILSFDLEVKNLDTGEVKQFQNLYFGNNPKDTSRIFSPMTIPGRESQSEVVMFFAKTTGAFFKTTGGVKLNLAMQLKLNTDQTEYWFKKVEPQTLDFNMAANFIQSFRNMEQGTPTVLYDERWHAPVAEQDPQMKKEQ